MYSKLIKLGLPFLYESTNLDAGGRLEELRYDEDNRAGDNFNPKYVRTKISNSIEGKIIGLEHYIILWTKYD